MGMTVVLLALGAVLAIGLMALLWPPQSEVVALDTAASEVESALEPVLETAPQKAALSQKEGRGDPQIGYSAESELLEQTSPHASVNNVEPTVESRLTISEATLTMGEHMADTDTPLEQSIDQAEVSGPPGTAAHEAVIPETLVPATPDGVPPSEPPVGSDGDASRATPSLPDEYRLGNAAFAQGNYAQALDYYTQAIAALPDLAEGYNNRGNVYYVLGQGNEALANYSQAIALRPSYATAYFNIGTVQYGLGNLEAAIVSFTQALEHHPSYAEAYNNRGNCYVIMQAYQEAIKDFDQALDLEPKFTAAYNNIGNLYYQIKNFDEALASYDQSLAIQADQPEAFNNRGNAYLALGNYAEAVENYNQALALKPDYAEAYYNRGLAHRKLGQTQQAQTDIAQAAQLAHQQHNAGLIRAMQATPV